MAISKPPKFKYCYTMLLMVIFSGKSDRLPVMRPALFRPVRLAIADHQDYCAGLHIRRSPNNGDTTDGVIFGEPAEKSNEEVWSNSNIP